MSTNTMRLYCGLRLLPSSKLIEASNFPHLNDGIKNLPPRGSDEKTKGVVEMIVRATRASGNDSDLVDHLSIELLPQYWSD